MNVVLIDEASLANFLSKLTLAGSQKKTFLFSISYMGCHPKPIDELIFFKMGTLHQQPVLAASLSTAKISKSPGPTDPTRGTCGTLGTLGTVEPCGDDRRAEWDLGDQSSELCLR